ncbi:hypothetical protein [Lysobacter auxotrophicus]|uniref:Uncharacterized protein n=1 Tax=Lysobacter auxotrophicus TaxID=2992573 RepID=A0ABM8DG48_9GAMM|nr:hypothetical protein [Lysobacter auxotrophicus]BDU17556.1 hypothetical protein LA521A_27570 [Lysobacter auxotrophicus]
MSACPIFSRLAADMARLGLSDDEQRAGETLPSHQPQATTSAREASPIPHLPNRAGKEL